MAQYIDKSAVVAEIEKIYNEDYKFLPSDIVESVEAFKDDLLIALNTLEVNEVDLEKEIEKYLLTNATLLIGGDSKLVVHHIAKHFFELGLKAQKGGDE